MELSDVPSIFVSCIVPIEEVTEAVVLSDSDSVVVDDCMSVLRTTLSLL